MKTATIRARIEPGLKSNVEDILLKLGLSTTEAITLFYRQIELKQGLPFRVELPNHETGKTLQASDQGKNLTVCNSADEMFNKLDI